MVNVPGTNLFGLGFYTWDGLSLVFGVVGTYVAGRYAAGISATDTLKWSCLTCQPV